MTASGGTPTGPGGNNGLINAVRRERVRYHERQRALLARVLRGKPKPAPGDPDPAG